MSQARDYGQPYTINGEYSIGPLYCPNIGFNNIEVGKEMARRLVQWKDEDHPEVPYDQVGFISINWSLSPQLNERTLGSKQIWVEKNPSFGAYNPDPSSELKNFFIADTASGSASQETATNLVTQIVSNAPDIKLWLVIGAFWDLTAGAAVAAQNMNMVDQFCITNFGSGANAISLWDAGEPTPIRFSLETASPVFAESIINALWTMMAGLATPDTLWPEWVVVWDKGDRYQLSSDLDPTYQVPKVEMGADGKPVVLEEHNYASMLLPMIWTDPSNYKEFYGWVDLYDLGPNAAAEDRTYPDFPLGTDINAFNARGTVPDYYLEFPTAG
jgi:ABC-type sugar transport system substrate-binding protein